MTKRIGIALALVLATTAGVEAQSVTASATIEQGAVLTDQRDLLFGTAVPGGAGDVVVGATATADNATGQMAFAEYQVNYNGASVTLSVPTELTDGGTNTIPVAMQCGESNQAGDALALGDCSLGFTLGYDGSGADLRRVWVGGSITRAAIDAAAAGDYEGTITFTLSTP